MDYGVSHEMFIDGTIGGRVLYSWWDQRQIIYRMDREKEYQDISPEGQEVIWAAIVHYQAFDLADWMVAKGYVATEVPGWGYGEDSFSCAPYDASTWDEWIQTKLCIPPSSVPADRRAGMLPYKISKARVCRKETIKEMVKRKYIKIPLNSGLPLYHWLLEGYKQDDFCELYSCIEYLGDYNKGAYTKSWSVEQMEVCLEEHMDKCLRAGTAFNMITVGFVCNNDEVMDLQDKVFARSLENMYLKYRDRNQWLSATKLQCMFRVYRAKRRANVLRSHPDNLFHAEFSASRKRKLEIDVTRFGAVGQ